jgi:hypothetical protein
MQATGSEANSGAKTERLTGSICKRVMNPDVLCEVFVMHSVGAQLAGENVILRAERRQQPSLQQACRWLADRAKCVRPGEEACWRVG